MIAKQLMGLLITASLSTKIEFAFFNEGNLFSQSRKSAPYRGTLNGGFPNAVYPDGLTPAFYYKNEGPYVQPTQEILSNYILYEVKATKGPLSFSYNRHQLVGMLEVLTEAVRAKTGSPIPTPDKRPVLFLITTNDAYPDATLIAEANRRGIMVWQSIAVFNPDKCCEMSFTQPIMWNYTARPGLDVAPKSMLGLFYPMLPLPLEPNPQLDTDTIDPEELGK